MAAPTPAPITPAAPSPSPSSAATNAPAVHASPSAGSASPPAGATTTCAPTSPRPDTSPPSTFGQGVRQWAQTAIATTSYSPYCDTAWNASQATGAPNATCSDDGKAWAAAAPDTIDTLTLTYANKVLPTAVRVIQSFNPGRVSKVTVSGGGQTATVYTGPANAAPGGTCVPFEIAVTGVAFPVDTVAVTVDQTRLGSWAEIDAVELVGTRSP